MISVDFGEIKLVLLIGDGIANVYGPRTPRQTLSQKFQLMKFCCLRADLLDDIIDGKGPVGSKIHRRLDFKSHWEHSPMSMQTTIKFVNSLELIGCGQLKLDIGDKLSEHQYLLTLLLTRQV
ncbi:hypothetical protein HPG69_012994 [Diceros bicornis minor]|uniref:Uncharacterized protein n=1 Tax=Diceros bicornis minor TaxID=77932 RepID=A0A7J7F1B9_DICBM|nr:hypothetical protein HPG69_012994 [Diceros bicornis minor]